MNVEGIQRKLEGWIKDQTSRFPKLQIPQFSWVRVRVKWPPWSTDREHRKKVQEEYERRRKQLHDLCSAVKAESLADLQDILCCMVLSECVYKRPAAELIRSVNKFKADFGGQVVCLERVQPSLDHVPHRYLLAEAGDTLFASFVGTKQYKDMMADANIFQGALFHEDEMEDVEEAEVSELDITNGRKGNVETRSKTPETKAKQMKHKLKPAAHRGFMARAKGIPALELYKLAQKKKRKLVLCGHSLGGAVAALATLAILRVIAASSPVKENEKFQVKCITFSQPPVGNAALRDYVIRKGWHQYFKTYCIPEDIIPRVLSPAYFDHYNAQTSSFDACGVTSNNNQGNGGVSLKDGKLKEYQEKLKDDGGEQLVLGVGPVQIPFWRLSRLIPLDGIRKHLPVQKGHQPVKPSSLANSESATSSSANIVAAPQSLEIEEGSDVVSLKPIAKSDVEVPASDSTAKSAEKSGKLEGARTSWSQMPYLPSYVPFGELYLLGTSSVESLSDAEYSKLTSVKSVFAELKERFQSHSMRTYRSRFQSIYDLCMADNPASFLGMENLQQFPHLQQWLGISIAGTVELGHIVESPSICTATSIAPLGWSNTPGEKNADPLKVDITGHGLHLCTLVQAQVNGNWCSTAVESPPSAPTYSESEQHPELHKMRVLIGSPLKNPPKHPMVTDVLLPVFPSIDAESINLKAHQILGSLSNNNFLQPPGLSNFTVYCTTDFTTVSKQVDVRTRRVRFVGLEGAGKTSLFRAILNKGRPLTPTEIENLSVETDTQESIVSGLCYMDSVGVNLQELSAEASRFRDELWMGIRDLGRKIDLLVLVHNLAHQIPRSSDPKFQQQPALSFLLDEAKSLGIPWVLAITNKFAVSAHQQRAAIDAVLKAYQASPGNTEIVNSCPYVIHTSGSSYASLSSVGAREETDRGMVPQGLVLGPINFVRRPFQRKATILPVEGVDSLCKLVHRELRNKEASSFEELARDRLLLELQRDLGNGSARKGDAQDNENSLSAATVGASLGAGLGIVLAVVMGAASALRKP
ncbi:hypothetical protein KSS87_009231 [Heliosperma pusillum]|nr:hypothetical protein KSS87_009231 [Heliosperma pusillum]